MAPQNTHLPLQSPVGMLWIHQRDTGWVVVIGKPVWDHALVICNREFYQLVRGGVVGGGGDGDGIRGIECYTLPIKPVSAWRHRAHSLRKSRRGTSYTLRGMRATRPFYGSRADGIRLQSGPVIVHYECFFFHSG